MKIIKGSFQDSRGNAISHGRVHFHLNETALVFGTGRVSPRDVEFQLDVQGELKDDAQIWANDELNPAGTYYRMAVEALGGGVVAGPEFIAIQGTSPINLNTLIPSPLPPLVPGGPTPPGPGLPIVVVISPHAPTLASGQQQQFTAALSNTTNQNVTWVASRGTISATGLFTAPTVEFLTALTVTATSVADPTKRDTVTVTVNPADNQLDLLEWVVMDARATQHLIGDEHAPYDSHWLDTDPGYPSDFPDHTIWYIKNKQGNPWDVAFYDDETTALSHWITENGDADFQAQCEAANNSSCWMYARAYKRNTRAGGIPILPRHFVPGSTITLDTEGPNTLIRTADCEATTKNANLGPVRAVTTGPFKISWGGSIDNGSGTLDDGPNYDNVNGVDTIRNQYMYSGSFAGGFRDIEETYYVKGFGRVAWYYFKNGVYVQKTVNTQLASGGHPAINFPCGPGKAWFVGPGGGIVTPPVPPTHTNLERMPGWTTNEGSANVGGSDPNPTFSMQQGVTQAGRTQTLQLHIQSQQGLWGSGRAYTTHLPTPPSGLVTLNGDIWVNQGTNAIGSLDFDTIVAQSNNVFHMGFKIDYTLGGLIMIHNTAGGWVSTGIKIGPLPVNSWNSFAIQMSINWTGLVASRLTFTFNGVQFVIPTSVAQMSARQQSWTDGLMLQLGVDTNNNGVGFTANYVDLNYTYGA